MTTDTYSYQPFLTMPEGFPAPQCMGIYDVYKLERHILAIASDRCPVPGQPGPVSIRNYGRMIHALGNYWREKLLSMMDFMSTNVVTTKLTTMYALDPRLFALNANETQLTGRTTLAKPCPVLPLNFPVYGYLDGLAWQEYQHTKTVAGMCLGPGYAGCGALPAPAFMTVVSDSSGISHVIARNEALAHINTFLEKTFSADVAKRHTNRLLEELQFESVRLYTYAADHAMKKGLLIANTTFRWGITLLDGGKSFLLKLLGDSLTPENSRYWSASHYKPGETQYSLPKRPLHDWLAATNIESACNPPKLPTTFANQVRKESKKLYKQLAGLQPSWS